MSIKWKHIRSFLGLAEGNNDKVELNDANLEKIDGGLKQASDASAENETLKTDLAARDEKIKTLEQDLVKANADLVKANTDLQAAQTELGKKDGAKFSSPSATGEEKPNKDVEASTMDFQKELFAKVY